LSRKSAATARSVLNDLSGVSDRPDLLKRFEAVNDKRIDEIDVCFNRFDGFNI
jgi:hypothetical protein